MRHSIGKPELLPTSILDPTPFGMFYAMGTFGYLSPHFLGPYPITPDQRTMDLRMVGMRSMRARLVVNKRALLAGVVGSREKKKIFFGVYVEGGWDRFRFFIFSTPGLQRINS